MDGGVVNYLFFQSCRITVALSANSTISKSDGHGLEALLVPEGMKGD